MMPHADLVAARYNGRLAQIDTIKLNYSPNTSNFITLIFDIRILEAE